MHMFSTWLCKPSFITKCRSKNSTIAFYDILLFIYKPQDKGLLFRFLLITGFVCTDGTKHCISYFVHFNLQLDRWLQSVRSELHIVHCVVKWFTSPEPLHGHQPRSRWELVMQYSAFQWTIVFITDGTLRRLSLTCQYLLSGQVWIKGCLGTWWISQDPPMRTVNAITTY